MRYSKKRFLSSGFTLIELLIVIAIIGILASIILASVQSVRAKSRDLRRLADIKQITSALELYYSDKGVYPPSQNDGVNCTPNFWDCSDYDTGSTGLPFIGTLVTAGYMIPIPVDPINNSTYRYQYWRGQGNLYSCTTAPFTGLKYILVIKTFESNPGYTNPNFCGAGGAYSWAGGNLE